MVAMASKIKGISTTLTHSQFEIQTINTSLNYTMLNINV